jgi:hypothetical protein
MAFHEISGVAAPEPGPERDAAQNVWKLFGFLLETW